MAAAAMAPVAAPTPNQLSTRPDPFPPLLMFEACAILRPDLSATETEELVEYLINEVRGLRLRLPAEAYLP